MQAAQDRGAVRARTVGLVAWIAVLGVAITGLTLAGRGVLATPALLGGEWAAWARQRDAVVIVFAALRLVALGVAWYLLGATIVGVIARLARWRGLVAIADTMTVPSVRRLLQSALGVGLASAAISVGSGHAGTPAAAPTVAAAAVPAEANRDDTAVMVPVGEAEQMTPISPAPTPAEPAVWTVRPGDHFWSIAESVLERAWGRRPTDDETSRYWRRLVERNRDELVDRDNPDLIVPDQRFELPEPPRP